MNYKISSIKSIPRDKSLDTDKHIPDLINTRHKINHIGALIQEAEAALDQSQQRDYTTEINKVISETKTDLSDMEARFCEKHRTQRILDTPDLRHLLDQTNLHSTI